MDYDKTCEGCKHDNGINTPCNDQSCKDMKGWEKKPTGLTGKPGRSGGGLSAMYFGSPEIKPKNIYCYGSPRPKGQEPQEFTKGACPWYVQA